MVIAISPRAFVASRHDQFVVEAPGLGSYVIDVSVPEKISEGELLPVILAVDGNLLFDIVHTAVHGRFARVAEAFPSAIVIGVGYPEAEGFASFYARRNFDFHGPWDMSDDLGLRLKEICEQLKALDGRPDIEMRAGGYELFMSFLRDELLPGLANHYPIDLAAKTTLVGDSAGGHFVLRAIFDPGSPFSRYVAISPSFRAAPGTIKQAEANYAALHTDLPVDIFVCSGTEEVGINRDYALCGFGSAVTWCADMIALRRWPSVNFHYEFMNNESHTSIAMRAISAGLRSVFHIRPGINEATSDY